MNKTISTPAILGAMLLGLSIGSARVSLAMEFQPVANPSACDDHNYKDRDCEHWSSLDELEHPDAWKYAVRNREDRSRWYGEETEKVVAVQQEPRIVVLEGVHFDFDQSVIRSDARPVLDANARDLKEASYERITVVGYTDSIGSEAYNQKLSERRAAAVKDYLISQGIDPNRISSEGRGESEPVAPNVFPNGEDNPEGRAQNRRVADLQIWDRQ